MKRLRKAITAARRRLTAKTADGGLLLVGLRNPGSRYTGTRHNIGADAVTVLAERHAISFRSAPRGIPADIGEGSIDEIKVRLALPTTFMNESGEAVGPLVRYFRPETLLVAHDDIDLAFDTLRVHHGRGSGGHNGVNSLVSRLGGAEFWRLRIGVGRPPGRIEPAAFVLQRFSENEESGVLIEASADVLEAFITGGEEAARQVAGNRPGRK